MTYKDLLKGLLGLASLVFCTSILFGLDAFWIVTGFLIFWIIRVGIELVPKKWANKEFLKSNYK